MVVPALAAALVLTGCIGATSRTDFDTEVRERGGGLSADLLIEAAERVESRQGDTGRLLIRNATLSHLSGSLQVSSEDFPREVDSWSWSEGSVRGPTPAGNADDSELDEHFTVDVLDAEVIEGAIDAAVVASGLRGAWAESVSFTGRAGNTYEARFSVTNRRETQSWSFGPDGALRRAG